MAEGENKNVIVRSSEIIFDKAIDIAALVVAVCAILVSIDTATRQDDLSIQSEKESHRPLLHIMFRKSDTNDMAGLMLKNLGRGTAEIKSFKYYLNKSDLDSSQFQKSWINSRGRLKFIPNDNDPLHFEEINTLDAGDLIPATERGDIYLVGTEKFKLSKRVEKRKDKHKQAFYGSETMKAMDKLIIEIEYKSLSSHDQDTTYFLRFCERFPLKNARTTNASTVYTAEKGYQEIN